MKYMNNITSFMKNVKNIKMSESKYARNIKNIESYFSNMENLDEFEFIDYENNSNFHNINNQSSNPINQNSLIELKKNFINSTFIILNLIQLQRFILRKIVVVSLNKQIESFENFDCSNSFVLSSQILVSEHTYYLERIFNRVNDKALPLLNSLQFRLIFHNDKIRIEFLEEFINKLYFCESSTYVEKSFDFINFNYLLKHLKNYLN